MSHLWHLKALRNLQPLFMELFFALLNLFIVKVFIRNLNASIKIFSGDFLMEKIVIYLIVEQ